MSTRKLVYTDRYLEFCKSHDGSGEGTHHIILRADGGLDEGNTCHLSVEDHKRAHEILYEDNPGNQLAQQAYSVTRGLGHPLDEDAREKIRVAHVGTTHDVSEETKMNISRSLTGRSLSEEHKQSTSEGIREKWKDQNYKDRVTEGLLNRKNKLWSRVCRKCDKEFLSNSCNARYCEDCK